VKTYQPSSDPFFRNPADDPRLPPVAEPGVTKDGKPKVALTMSFMTTQGAPTEVGCTSDEISPADVIKVASVGLLRVRGVAGGFGRRFRARSIAAPG